MGFASLATVEVQLILRYADPFSLIRLGRCCKHHLAAASTRFACAFVDRVWMDLPNRFDLWPRRQGEGGILRAGNVSLRVTHAIGISKLRGPLAAFTCVRLDTTVCCPGDNDNPRGFRIFCKAIQEFGNTLTELRLGCASLLTSQLTSDNKLRSLRVLHLSNVECSDARAVDQSAFAQVTELRLHETRWASNPMYDPIGLSYFTNLATLTLCAIASVQVYSILSSSSLRKLTSLKLHTIGRWRDTMGNAFWPQIFTNLPQLISISLWDVHNVDSILQDITNHCPNIQQVDVLPRVFLPSENGPRRTSDILDWDEAHRHGNMRPHGVQSATPMVLCTLLQKRPHIQALTLHLHTFERHRALFSRCDTCMASNAAEWTQIHTLLCNVERQFPGRVQVVLHAAAALEE